MATAFVAYRFGCISPGATVGVYLHGFSPDWFATYCVTPFKASTQPPAFFAQVALTTGPVSIATDGTLAREAWVTNQSTSTGARPVPLVDLNVLIEPIQR